MKLTPTCTVEAPIGRVFDALLDFANPRNRLPQNAEVVRTDTLAAPGPGMSWQMTIDLRGHRREVRIELADWTPPERLRFEAASPGLAIYCTAVLSATAPDRTRVDFDLDLKPDSLSSRLLVNSLKLAKYQITRRLETRLTGVLGAIVTRAA